MLVTEALPSHIVVDELMPPSGDLRCSSQSSGVVDIRKDLRTGKHA